MADIDKQLEPAIKKFNESYNSIITGCKESVETFVTALKGYYLDPCIDTYEACLNIAFAIEKEANRRYYDWDDILDIVSNPSSGLAISFMGYGEDNEDKFRMNAISPRQKSADE